jgi:hypothetical protein
LGHIGVINYKFFFNYFFSSFFGSYFFGGLCLILFILALIKNLVNKRNRKDIIYFHIILILNTYIFLILYTFFKTEIAVPRYFIFLIPSIIFVIMDLFKLKNIKFFLFLLLIIAMINTLVCLAKGRIPKPPIKNLISQLSVEDSNIILHVENWFDIYLDNLDLLKKNYKIIKKSDVDKYNNIWFVCFNNIRADRGNVKIEDEKKCIFDLKNFTKEKIINIPDFKIILFSKIR